jgi:gas vesicle protein
MAEKSASHSHTSAGILAFLVGAGAGLAAGILFAPRQGRETREQLKVRADRARQRLQSAARKEKEMVGDAVDSLKQAAAEGREALKDVKAPAR